VATAVSAQVAIALTRATAIEASARMEAAREGERLRTALIDSLTHELRTPLTAIRAAATTLRAAEGLDEAAKTELAAVVDEESARLDALIGEAFEMAEIDANTVEVHLSQQHPRALLDQAVEESRKALAGRRVVIAAEEPGAPDGAAKPAWFDPHLLGRVLRHLLENAGRCTPPGGRILLGSQCIGDRLEFRVEDDGPASTPLTCPSSSTSFTVAGRLPAKAREPGWDWRLPAPFWPRTAEGSRPKAFRDTGPASASGCRWWKRNQPGLRQRKASQSSLIQCSFFY
jgi:two-component system sensor histidine kinase KdpD